MPRTTLDTGGGGRQKWHHPHSQKAHVKNMHKHSSRKSMRFAELGPHEMLAFKIFILGAHEEHCKNGVRTSSPERHPSSPRSPGPDTLCKTPSNQHALAPLGGLLWLCWAKLQKTLLLLRQVLAECHKSFLQTACTLCLTLYSDLLPGPRAQISHCLLDMCTWKSALLASQI